MLAILLTDIIQRMRKLFIILLLCVQAMQISWAAAHGITGEQSFGQKLQHAVAGTAHHDPSAHPFSDTACADCCVAHACHAPGFPFAGNTPTFSLNMGSAGLCAVDRQHHGRDFSGRIERPKWSAA